MSGCPFRVAASKRSSTAKCSENAVQAACSSRMEKDRLNEKIEACAKRSDEPSHECPWRGLCQKMYGSVR